MRVLIKIAALVGVLVLSGCQNTLATALPAGSVDYCTIMADPPTKTGKTVDAPGRYRCDGKGADTITLTVTLQRRSKTGSWQRLKTRTFTAHGTDTSRTLNEGKRTRHVTVACANGWYRTVVHAVEKSKGHTQAYDMHSVPVPNPCKI